MNARHSFNHSFTHFVHSTSPYLMEFTFQWGREKINSFILHDSLMSRYRYYPHFTDGETEAHNREVTCTGTHRQEVAAMGNTKTD